MAQVRAESAADLDRRQLGPLLHQAGPGGDGRDLDELATPGTGSAKAAWSSRPINAAAAGRCCGLGRCTEGLDRRQELPPFTGPLKKQDGSDFLGDGEVVDDGTLAGMSFYVEGIVGDIPS